MISVSESFKKAIKEPNRNIYGYVDVEYQHEEYSLVATKLPQLSEMVVDDGSGLFANKKIMPKYATLESNYTLLDGSFMVWNENIKIDAGIITEDVFNDISDTEITIVNDSDDKPVKGITIYFKDNLPFNFDIDYVYDGDIIYTDYVRDNSLLTYQRTFPSEENISEISIRIINVEHPNNRLRIASVDFNLSDLYDGDQLVSFDVSEEIDLLVEELPINTCSVKLNNYPSQNGGNRFDPINPTSIVRYLTSDATMKPYIGILTETNGIEYVPMGVFYISDWSSDVDGNVSINGQSLMGLLKNTTISSDGTFLRSTFTGTQIANYFGTMTGYSFNFVSGTYNNNYLQDTNLLNWIQAQMPFQIMWYNPNSASYNKRKFRITRYNVATEDNLSDEIVDYISRSELRSDVKYETKSVIKTVEVTDISSFNRSSSTIEAVVEDTYVLKAEEEYVWYHLKKHTNYNSSTFNYTSTGGATATLIDKNYYMIYVKFSGNIGDTVSINYSGYIYDDPPTKVHSRSNDLALGDVLSLDFSKYFDARDSSIDSSIEYYLTEDSKYKITMETIGDPSLEVGDTIAVQTRYVDNSDGYKNVIITRQDFTFDGGLQCNIEARGN